MILQRNLSRIGISGVQLSSVGLEDLVRYFTEKYEKEILSHFCLVPVQ